MKDIKVYVYDENASEVIEITALTSCEKPLLGDITVISNFKKIC